MMKNGFEEEKSDSSASLESANNENDEVHDVVPEPDTQPPMTRSRLMNKEVRTKRLTLYKNGDHHFEGWYYYWRPDRVKTLEGIYDEATAGLKLSPTLPSGVRAIFNLDGRKIQSVEELVAGESYVCSSTDVFKPIKNIGVRKPLWHLPNAFTPRDTSTSVETFVPEPNEFVQPKLIRVMRNSALLRGSVQFLLNKKTARSFQQIMQELSDLVKLPSGAIRKLYALNGTEVTGLEHFYTDETVFVAFGNEKSTTEDLENIRNLMMSRKSPRRVRKLPARNHPNTPARRLADDDQPEYVGDDMILIRRLGDGITATVYEVEHTPTGGRFAMKVISRENYIEKEHVFGKEIDILKELQHSPDIAKFLEGNVVDGALYMRFELCPAGDLFDFLTEHEKVSEEQAAQMIRCVTQALDFMHERRIVHRDIKPENLLLIAAGNGMFNLKVTDFGLSSYIAEGQLLYDCCGTPTYVAPEVLLNDGYGFTVDIWSLGIILYIVLVGFPPFQAAARDEAALFNQIVDGFVYFPSPAFDKISWAARLVIIQMLQGKELRPTAKELPHIAGDWYKDATSTEEYEEMARVLVMQHLAFNMPEGEDFDDPADFVYEDGAARDELADGHADP